MDGTTGGRRRGFYGSRLYEHMLKEIYSRLQFSQLF